jgi:hypothetical protein
MNIIIALVTIENNGTCSGLSPAIKAILPTDVAEKA